MTLYRTDVVASELAFPEGPRWHNGRLWFTDQHARAVCALDPDDRLERVAQSRDLPGGLGWLPDGSLLVVFMTQRRIMRLSGGTFEEYVDLSGHAAFHCNDMVIDRAGRIYAGNFGFDLHGGEAQRPTRLLLIDSDRRIETFAEDVVFPNGSVITPEGAQLLVSETFAHRVSAFALDAQGRMQSRSVWSLLGDSTPDGICLDQDGALWVASPGTHELIRVKQGGTVLDRCETLGTPYACMLGGEDRRTLYVCTSETDDPQVAAQRKSGRIEQARVRVAGAGLP